MQLPEGLKISAEAPSLLTWEASRDGVVQLAQDPLQVSLTDHTWPIRLSAVFREGQTTLHGELAVYYCSTENESVCLIWRRRLNVPVLVSAQASRQEAEVTLQVGPPTVP